MLKTLIIKPVNGQVLVTAQTEYSGSLVEESIILPSSDIIQALTPQALMVLLQDGDLRGLERAVRQAGMLRRVSNADFNDD